ncbi:MAG: cupin domain-containing protein [Streptosporangiaceae bacterium]
MDADGIMLPPGGGEEIAGLGATLKAAMGPQTSTSSFEVVIGPGYDVGAHVHTRGEEVFFVLEGEVDLLAFEPVDRTLPDWHEWQSRSGRRFLRGGPGAFMHVPSGVPHAFANRTSDPVRMFFQSSVPGGHENYFREMADLLRGGGPPDQEAIARLRDRYDIVQLTDVRTGATRYRGSSVASRPR